MEANLIKSVLDANNIECFILHQNTMQARPELQLTGGVQIQVKKEDYKDALGLIAD